MTKYNAVELKDGVNVNYLGVYVLNWRPEWGKPDIGFVEEEEPKYARLGLATTGNLIEEIIVRLEPGKSVSYFEALALFKALRAENKLYYRTVDAYPKETFTELAEDFNKKLLETDEERYPPNWKHATIHLNPETGEICCDGDESVKILIEERYKKIRDEAFTEGCLKAGKLTPES